MIGSKSSDFPMINSINNTHGGNWDTGIAEFSNNGTLLFSTYFGGSGQDLGTEIIMNNNDLYLFGYTQSEDIPIINSSTNYSGLGDAFFAKFHFYPTTPTTTSLSISITTETDTVITSVVNNSPSSTSDQSNSIIRIISYPLIILLLTVTRLKKKKFL